MVIVTLVAAGVGLAIDKYSERKLRKEEERRGYSDDQFDGVITRISSDEERQRREEEAFNELQGYANFQNDLSTKVLSDIDTEDTAGQYGGSSIYEKRTINYGPTRTQQYSPLQQGKLQWPIIIPQDSRCGDGSFVRAFPRPLLECGIDQNTFMNVLDSMVIQMKLSTRLEAVNIARTTNAKEWQDGPETFSRAIPAAVQVMKAYQKDRKSNAFLNHVNALTFKPRGLFAMIITCRPDVPSEVIMIEVPSTPAPKEVSEDIQMSMDASSAPISPATTTSSSIQYQSDPMDIDNLLNQQSTNGSDQHNSSPIPTGRSHFSSFLSSVTKHRGRPEAVNKRVRKDKRPTSRVNANRNPAFESASSLSISASSNQPHRVDASRSRANSMNMESAALYLVIVNDPDAPSIQTMRPKTSQPREVYRYPSVPTMTPIIGNNGKRPMGGGIMGQPFPIPSSAPRRQFYDPVYDAPRGAPPAYSPG